MNNVTVKQVKDQVKVEKILFNLGLQRSDPDFSYLLKQGMAMREYGMNWRDIDKTLEEKAEYSHVDLLQNG